MFFIQPPFSTFNLNFELSTPSSGSLIIAFEQHKTHLYLISHNQQQ